jgi:hypothetical protein
LRITLLFLLPPSSACTQFTPFNRTVTLASSLKSRMAH